MRQPISYAEYQKKERLRVEKIFDELKPILRNAIVLMSFEWKADKCQAKLMPIP